MPLLASASGDILEVFLVKHGLVCTQLGRFNFSSKTFRPEDKKKAVMTAGGGTSIGQTNLVSLKCAPNGVGFMIQSKDTRGKIQSTQAPQTAAIRTYLRGKYAAVKLFQAREAYAPKDQLDIGVNAGDLVGVVQQKDPLGNRDRWFVDNGLAQGFVQSRVLGPIGDTVAEEAVYAPAPLGAPRPVARNQYDDVAPDEDAPSEAAAAAKQPVRKAPPVPQASAADAGPSEMQPADERVADAAEDKEPPSSGQIAQEKDANYDEFAAAASEVETEVRTSSRTYGDNFSW